MVKGKSKAPYSYSSLCLEILFLGFVFCLFVEVFLNFVYFLVCCVFLMYLCRGKSEHHGSFVLDAAEIFLCCCGSLWCFPLHVNI